MLEFGGLRATLLKRTTKKLHDEQIKSNLSCNWKDPKPARKGSKRSRPYSLISKQPAAGTSTFSVSLSNKVEPIQMIKGTGIRKKPIRVTRGLGPMDAATQFEHKNQPNFRRLLTSIDELCARLKIYVPDEGQSDRLRNKQLLLEMEEIARDRDKLIKAKRIEQEHAQRLINSLNKELEGFRDLIDKQQKEMRRLINIIDFNDYIRNSGPRIKLEPIEAKDGHCSPTTSEESEQS